MPAPCIWLVEPHSRTHADTPATHAPLGQGLIAVSAPIILSTVSLATALLIIGFAVRTRRVLQRQAELLHQNHTLAVMEERLTKLLAHADDAVVIVSDQGPVLWTSPSFTRMLGWKGPHNFAGPDASLGGRTVETLARCGGLTWAENTGTWAVVAGAAESDGTSDAVATLAARRDCPARRR